jgi:hypothetical protein
MGTPFGNNVHTQVFVSLVLIGSIISSFASIFMLYMIKRLKIWNGHILLLTTMTIFQLIYDITFFPGVINLGNNYVAVVSNVIQLFSGIASSLISNVLAFITFYIINYKKRFNIMKHYYLILLLVLIPAIIDCTLFLISVIQANESLSNIAVLGIYYDLKLISIGINFILVSLTSLEINRISSGKSVLSSSEISMKQLSQRLFYYPIVQSLSRVGCAWYEFEYQYNNTGNNEASGFDFNPSHTTNKQFAAQIVLAITMPVASIGYLIIFLLMQPRAYGELKRLLGFNVDPLLSENETSFTPRSNHDAEQKEGYIDGAEDKGDNDEETDGDVSNSVVHSLHSFVSFSDAASEPLRISLVENEF